MFVVVNEAQTASYLRRHLAGEGRERLLELYAETANSCGDREEQYKPRFFNSRKHYVPPEKRPKLSRPVTTLEQCFSIPAPTGESEDLSPSPPAPSPSPRVKFVAQQTLLYPHQAAQLLEESRPQVVVLYHPDLSWIRQLECYQAMHSELQLTVTFLMTYTVSYIIFISHCELRFTFCCTKTQWRSSASYLRSVTRKRPLSLLLSTSL